MRKNIITITKNAFGKMKEILKKSHDKSAFLFGINSGGCNGFNFDLKLIDKNEINEIKKKKPNVISENNVEVYVDPLSELYLIGTEIDFLMEDFSKGIFESKFIYNVDKQKAVTCGCGVSFTPKEFNN